MKKLLFSKIPVMAIIIMLATVTSFTGCLSLLGISGQSGASEVEPNDQSNVADRVNGYLIDGYIDSGSDVDWFVLGGQEGVTPVFTIHHDPGVDIDFSIHDSSSGYMQQVGSAVGTQSGDSIRVRTPGLVHVKVWSHSGTGAYRIQIQR